MTDVSTEQLSCLLARACAGLAAAGASDPALISDLQSAEQWLDTNSLSSPMDVHVAFIDHREGGNLYAALSRETLLAEIAEYCREWWPEIRDHRDPTSLDDDQVADAYFDRHDEEYLRVERIPVELPSPNASSPLRIRRYLVLSTSHIRPSTADLLDQWAPMPPEARPLGVAEAGYGWFVLTDPLEGAELEMVPVDLRAAIDFARGQGCRWLLLDRDADCVAGLDTFDW